MSVDDDALRTELDRLVRPVHDVDGIIAEVERRRTRAHRRRTAVRLVAAASVLVLVGTAAAVLAVRDADREVVTAGPAPIEPAPPGSMTPTGPSVTVTTTDLGPLHVTTSELVPSETAWLEHTITIQNTGTETIYVDDHRTGGFLGQHELVVGDEGCGYGSGAEGEPVVAPACRMDRRDLVLEPGERVTSRISLWRDLPGLRPVTSEMFEFRKPLRHDTHGFIDPERRPVDGEIVLTYRGLADVGATQGETSTADESTDATPRPVESAVPGPEGDDAPELFFDPPVGFDASSSETPGLQGEPILVYSFFLESWVVEGAIGQELNVAVMRVPDELAEVRDPVAFATQWMGHEFVEEEIGDRQVAVARRSAVLSGTDLGLPDRVSDTYALRIGDAAIQIGTMDVDERAVVEALIASIDEQALARALAAAG